MAEAFYTVLEFAFTWGVIAVMAFFAYMSSHLVSEKKAGHTIPLPWEKKHARKTTDSLGPQTNGTEFKGSNASKNAKGFIFEKPKIEYTDGDNT